MWNGKKSYFAFLTAGVIICGSLFAGCGDNKSGKKSEDKITVNPGDVIFDNQYAKLTFTEVKVDYPMEGMIEIRCVSKGKIDYKEGIAIAAYKKPLVINGKDSNIYSADHAVIGVGNPNIRFLVSHMEEIGISLAELKTVQATFFVFRMGNDKDVLYERTVLFTIK